VKNKFIENLELNKKEIEEKKVILKSKPINLMIVLTGFCNLSCIMCQRKNSSNKSFLPYGKMKKILSELSPYLRSIDWQGGEVFLVPYFKELLLETAKFENIEHSIITNGHLIDEDWIEIFKKLNINLTFSIDAVTKKTYEYIRQKSDFGRVLFNLNMIQTRAPNVNLHLNVVVMKRNYRELDLFPEFCHKYGIKHLRFDFLRSDIVPEEDILFKEDDHAKKYLKDILSKIESKCKELNIWFEVTFKDLLNKKNNEINLKNSNLNFKSSKAIRCKLPWRKLYIDSCLNGGIRPDCLCEKEIGNINDIEHIEEVWNSKSMIEYRKRLIGREEEGWCSKVCNMGLVDTHHFEGLV